jgi:hypothetical protein
MKHDITGQHSPIPQSLFVRDFFHCALVLCPWLFEAYEPRWKPFTTETPGMESLWRGKTRSLSTMCTSSRGAIRGEARLESGAGLAVSMLEEIARKGLGREVDLAGTGEGRGRPPERLEGVEKKPSVFAAAPCPTECGTNAVSSNRKVSHRCFTQPLIFSGVGKIPSPSSGFLHVPLQHFDWLKLGIMKHQPLKRASARLRRIAAAAELTTICMR